MKIDLEKMFEQYVETALWSEIDDNGDPLDENYALEDIDGQSLKNMKKDCKDFIRHLKERKIKLCLRGDDTNENEISEMLGHDFWLTRNRHGAGFWDGDWENGEVLTELSHNFGGSNLYVFEEKVYLQ